jgi:hypothetical protein
MTTINKVTTEEVQAPTRPQDKAFYLSAGFNLPGRNGRRLTLTFNAAVTFGDTPTG